MPTGERKGDIPSIAPSKHSLEERRKERNRLKSRRGHSYTSQGEVAGQAVVRWLKVRQGDGSCPKVQVSTPCQVRCQATWMYSTLTVPSYCIQAESCQGQTSDERYNLHLASMGETSHREQASRLGLLGLNLNVAAVTIRGRRHVPTLPD
jgi:hypothetical protein